MRQRWLPFGGREHFELLHGRHGAAVAICESVGRWREGLYAHDEAGEFLGRYALAGALNVYQSQCGFAGRRKVESVAALTSCWVDLDTYRAGDRDYTPDELLDAAYALAPWLPMPTAVIHSGRGWYFSWVFDRPLAPEHLPKWQWVQDALTAALAPLGADSVCRDPTRVLRVVGTINSKSGRAVSGYQQTAAPLSFAALERTVRGAQKPSETPKRQAPERQRQQFLRGAGLAQARMADCHALAVLRGSPEVSDYRSRLLYAYALSGAWYWADREQAHDELAAFSAEHFVDGRRYTAARVRTVLERMAQAWAGVVGIWQGRPVDRRYAPSNGYFLRLLEVTVAEQQAMRTLIGRDERQRRRAQRRRDAGMVTREEYLGVAAERRSEALRLRLEGLTQAAIASRLGVTQQWVSRLLKAEGIQQSGLHIQGGRG